MRLEDSKQEHHAPRHCDMHGGQQLKTTRTSFNPPDLGNQFLNNLIGVSFDNVGITFANLEET